MSRHRVLGLPGRVVDLIDNWIACAHSGPSVVPRDFYREVDRFEARPEPDFAAAAAVEAVYRRELAACRARALVLVALVFGAPSGRLRELAADDALRVRVGADGRARRGRFGQREADEVLLSFAREIERIDVAWAAPKIPAARPMAELTQFRVARPRDRAPAPVWSKVAS